MKLVYKREVIDNMDLNEIKGGLSVEMKFKSQSKAPIEPMYLSDLLFFFMRFIRQGELVYFVDGGELVHIKIDNFKRPHQYQYDKSLTVRRINFESPLLIVIDIPTITLLLTFIQTLVMIYGPKETKLKIKKILRSLIDRIKDPKSIFIVDDNDINKEEFETLDLDDIPQDLSKPDWAKIVELEILGKNKNEEERT